MEGGELPEAMRVRSLSVEPVLPNLVAALPLVANLRVLEVAS